LLRVLTSHALKLYRTPPRIKPEEDTSLRFAPTSDVDAEPGQVFAFFAGKPQWCSNEQKSNRKTSRIAPTMQRIFPQDLQEKKRSQITYCVIPAHLTPCSRGRL
jgi:hypothetical protein